MNFSGSGNFNVGTNVIHGDGDFTKGGSGSGTLTGSIMTKGTFTASGSWSALAYENSIPVPPGGGAGTSGDLIGISAWQK